MSIYQVNNALLSAYIILLFHFFSSFFISIALIRLMWRPIEEGKGTVKPKKDIRIQQQFEATIDIVFPFEGERTLNKHELDLSSTFWAM